jgi:hypothetical protein
MVAEFSILWFFFISLATTSSGNPSCYQSMTRFSGQALSNEDSSHHQPHVLQLYLFCKFLVRGEREPDAGLVSPGRTMDAGCSADPDPGLGPPANPVRKLVQVPQPVTTPENRVVACGWLVRVDLFLFHFVGLTRGCGKYGLRMHMEKMEKEDREATCPGRWMSL